MICNERDFLADNDLRERDVNWWLVYGEPSPNVGPPKRAVGPKIHGCYWIYGYTMVIKYMVNIWLIYG